MRRYLVDRIVLTTLPTLFALALLVFAATHTLVPAKTKAEWVRQYGRANHTFAVRRINHDIGWHHDTPSQFAHWLGISWFWGGPTGIMQGNLGVSLNYELPIWPTIRPRLAQTLEEVVLAQFLAIAGSLPLAAIAVRYQGRWPDRVVGAFTRFSVFPGTILALWWILFGSIWFNWSPATVYRTLAQDPIANLSSLVVPCLLMALLPMGIFVRLARYEILTATAPRLGSPEGEEHPAIESKTTRLRHGLVPLVLAASASMQLLLGVTILYEMFFLIPGIGFLTYRAMNVYDYPTLTSVIIVLAFVCVLITRVAELTCAFLMAATVQSAAEWREVGLRNSMYGTMPKRPASRN